jgi:hypothetical protein
VRRRTRGRSGAARLGVLTLAAVTVAAGPAVAVGPAVAAGPTPVAGGAPVAPAEPDTVAVTSAVPGCSPADTTLTGLTATSDWQPVTPDRWRLDGGELVMTAAGTPRPGPIRPYEHAVLTRGPRLGAVEVHAQVRIDTPVRVRDRDAVLLLGYRSDTHYAYVHLAQDAASSNHNGIFLVAGTDRVRIDDQGTGGAPPSIADTDWHEVTLTHCPDTGRVEVRVDGAAQPLLTATDRRIGSGRVGFGSFDNVARARDVRVRGVATSVDPCPPATATRFVDHHGSPHERPIDCAAHHGLVRGFGDGTFRPGEAVRRGQFATILAATSEAAGGVLPGETGRFRDVAGSPHEQPIERLAAAGVVGGYGDGTFGAGDRVTRAQAASLLDRALTRLRGSQLPPGAARFDDVSGVHADAIARLAEAGILAGTGPRTFSPQRTLTRGQAASLAIRAWEQVEVHGTS